MKNVSAPNKYHTAKKQKYLIIIATLILILVVCWFLGFMGMFITNILLPRFLPIRFGKHLQITNLQQGETWQHQETSACIYISPARATHILRSISPWSYLLPPNTIRNNIIVEGKWTHSLFPGEKNKILPFAIVITDIAQPNPKVFVKCTVQDFNNLLRNRYGEDTIRKRKKWLLGTYELAYKLTFDSLHAQSDKPFSHELSERTLSISATGSVKLDARDGLLHASAKARVDKLTGRIIIRFSQQNENMHISYEGFVDELKADARNVSPWIDSKISEDLRESLEKSLNKEKTKTKISKLALPLWTPTDVEIQFIVFSQPN